MKQQRDLKKRTSDSHFLPRAIFSNEAAKYYILATILLFHIVPVILNFSGSLGKSFLNTTYMIYIGTLISFGILFIYGIKEGFNFKMPLLFTVLSSISTVMYYGEVTMDTVKEYGLFGQPLIRLTTMFIIYGVMSFLGILAGSFVKHFKVF